MKAKIVSWSLLILLSLIWGSSFILMKKGLIAYSPLQLACIRIGIAGLVLLPFALKYIAKLNLRTAFFILLFGLCNAGIPAYLFALAETKVLSSTAGVLNALTPIFTLIVGILFFRVMFNKYRMLGVVIGFSGALLLIIFGNGFQEGFKINQEQLLYASLLIPATVMYGFSANIIKTYLNTVPGIVISVFSYLFFLPIVLTLLFSTNFVTVVNTPEGLNSLMYIAILATFGSALAILIFSKLIQTSNALFATYVTYMVPVVSLFWGALDGEKIGYFPIISLIIIICGILISGLGNRKIKEYNTDHKEFSKEFENIKSIN